MTTERWCHICETYEPFGPGWFSFHLKSGRMVALRVTDPALWFPEETVLLVCGEGSALVMAERFFQSGNFEPAQRQPHLVAEDVFAPLT